MKIRITNYIIFNMVMRNPVYCKDIIERILGRKISEIRYEGSKTTVEENITVSLKGRNIRLDVRFEDDDAWYNVEMQVENQYNIPKRARYHHSTIDVMDLQKQKEAVRAEDSGKIVTFNDLKESYVIFICCFDPFDRGRTLYEFENREKSENDLCLGDHSYTIILNTTVAEEHLSPELRSFVEYVRDDTVDENDSMLTAIDKYILEINQEYGGETGMTFEEELYIAKEIAEEKGKQKGLEEGLQKGLEEGQEKNLVSNIKKMMKKLSISMEEAMDVLEVAEGDRARIAEAVAALTEEE